MWSSLENSRERDVKESEREREKESGRDCENENVASECFLRFCTHIRRLHFFLFSFLFLVSGVRGALMDYGSFSDQRTQSEPSAPGPHLAGQLPPLPKPGATLPYLPLSLPLSLSFSLSLSLSCRRCPVISHALTFSLP